MFINVDDISTNNDVAIAVTDERFAPLDDFDAHDCLEIDSGLRSTVKWNGGEMITTKQPLRLRVDISGPRATDVRLYAVYVAEAEQRT